MRDILDVFCSVWVDLLSFGLVFSFMYVLWLVAGAILKWGKL